MTNPIIANDPNKLIWLRLKQLTSVQVCQNLMLEKYNKQGLAGDDLIVEKKAVGLSSAIEAALGYWDETPRSLNSWVLSRYYALLQFTIAEQVSSPKNNSDLASVQKHTEQGHGLAIWLKDIENPLDYRIYALKSGHFYSYAKHLGCNPKKWAAEKRARKMSDLDQYETVTIGELFSCIAELEPVLFSFIQKPSRCLHIGHSTENYRHKERLREQQRQEGNFSFDIPKSGSTFVDVYSNPENPIDIELVRSTGIPLTEIGVKKNEDTAREIFTGELTHNPENLWWSCIEHYKSDYTGSMYIEPLFGEVSDVIVRHFYLLYGLSILVRYMPDVWHEITTGKHDNVGALIEYYLTVFEGIIPTLMLERITGKEIRTAQPGSLNGLV